MESEFEPDLSPIGGTWGKRQPEYHRDPMNRIALGRRIAHIQGIEWPYQPEDCQVDKNEWILDGQVLICTGCGINGT